MSADDEGEEQGEGRSPLPLIDAYDPERPEAMSSWLSLHLGAYWSSYLDYWGLRGEAAPGEAGEEAGGAPEVRAVHRKLEAIGTAVRKLLHTLSPDAEAVATIRAFVDVAEDEHPREAAAEVIQALRRTPIVRDNVRIGLGFEATGELLPRAEARIADLMGLIAARAVTPRAASFLDRATRLYLWGFDPECVILCRSVLESALTSRVSDEIELDGEPTLDNLLRIAGELEILDGLERTSSRRGWRAKKGTPLWRAERLKWAGNHVLHDQPEIEPERETDIGDALTAVSELADVLSLLFPP